MTPFVSKPTVAVAMSGGVDSAVTAACLVREGWPVIGITLRLLSETRRAERSCTAIDDAQTVAAQLGIPHRVLDGEAAFDREVAQPFTAAYAAGETPNPCVACNSRLKFGVLLDYARREGAAAIATGHYARIRREPDGRYAILRAIDAAKDQSYFLYDLTQPQLAATRFPLGGQHKADTRRLAREWGLLVADKPDSQQVCFAAGNYRAFLRNRLGTAMRPGAIVDTAGRVRGEHGGVALFTVGQRHGLGLGNAEPLYVVALDPAEDRVVVGAERELRRETAFVGAANWVSIAAPDRPLRVFAQLRRAHVPAEATLIPEGQEHVRLLFTTPQRAIAAGQAAVFYDFESPERLIGGGRIVREARRASVGERQHA